MNVLVAGCGWLGREVARRLAARGDRVTGLTRTVASASGLLASGIDAAALDVSQPGAWRSLRGRFDGIVAAQSAAGRDEDSYRRAYVEATRELLAAASAWNAALVYVGSTGVFGNTDGSWVDETTSPQPADGTSEVLLEAERLVVGRATNVAPTRVVRCSGLYGPGRTGTIDRVRSGLLALGDGDDAWMNFSHRDDAAALVVAALDRGRPGAIYHASDAAPATRRDVVSFISERLGIESGRREADAVAPRTRGAGRRVSSEASRRELGVVLAYPTFREGFAPFLR